MTAWLHFISVWYTSLLALNTPLLRPKILHNHCLQIILAMKMSQEKSKTMPMQFFFFLGGGGGSKRGVFWDCASRELVCSTPFNFGQIQTLSEKILSQDVMVTAHELKIERRSRESRRSLVQSLNSPFFPPPIGAESGRSKGESLLSPARVQSLYEGREERGVQGLD